LRDRAALGALLWPTGDADAQGIRGDRGSGGERVRALGRLRGAQPGRDDAERLGDVVKVHWGAVAKDGEAFGVGLNFLVLAADGRIERDYTFVVAWGWALRCSQSRKGVSASEAGSGRTDEFSVVCRSPFRACP
jgi:hypothetical protein